MQKEIRKDVINRYILFLKKKLQEECLIKGVTEIGCTGIDINSVSGLIAAIAGVRKLEA